MPAPTRKQTSNHDDWLAALGSVQDRVPESRVEELIATGVTRVRQAEKTFGRLGYCWSGGKDSQAIRAVAEAAGIAECVLVISVGRIRLLRGPKADVESPGPVDSLGEVGEDRSPENTPEGGS